MKINKDVSLAHAAEQIERKLLIAAEEKDTARVDELLDLLRAIETIDQLAAPGAATKERPAH